MKFKRKKNPVPEEYYDLYLSEQNALNFRHIRNVSFVMVFLMIIYLLQHYYFPGAEVAENAQSYNIIFYLMIAEGLIFLLVPKVLSFELKEFTRKVFLLIYLYSLAFLIMCLTYNDLHYGQELSGYIILLMFFSTMVWLNLKEFAFISTFVLFLLIISYLLLHSLIPIQLYQFVQGGVFYILSWVLYLSIFNVRVENLLNRITMEQQYKMLETESATDPLTGLYNRRHLKEEIQNELARSERSEVKFCILLLDIDHFKKINDKYGHKIGDDVLKELSAILRNSVRLSDKVFRYGGEEFMILLPETLAIDARILAERIREKIENYSFTNVRNKVCISGGIAQSSKDSSLDLLIQKADKRLYFAKENGRNTIVWDEDPFSEKI